MALPVAVARLLGSAARRLTGEGGTRGESAARKQIRRGSVQAGRRAYREEQKIARKEATALGLKGAQRRRYVAERAQEARNDAKSEFSSVLDNTDSYVGGLPESVATEAVRQLRRGNIDAAGKVVEKFARESITREKSKQRTRLIDDRVAGAIRGGASLAERNEFLAALSRGSSVTEAAREQAAKSATVVYADVRRQGREAFEALTQARRFNDLVESFRNIRSLPVGVQNRLMREAGLTRDSKGVWRDKNGVEWDMQSLADVYEEVTPIDTRATLIQIRDSNTGEDDHATPLFRAAEGIAGRAVRQDTLGRENFVRSMVNSGFADDFPTTFALISKRVSALSAGEFKRAVEKVGDGAPSKGKTHVMFSSDNDVLWVNVKPILKAFGIDLNDIPENELEGMPAEVKYSAGDVVGGGEPSTATLW